MDWGEDLSLGEDAPAVEGASGANMLPETKVVAGGNVPGRQ